MKIRLLAFTLAALASFAQVPGEPIASDSPSPVTIKPLLPHEVEAWKTQRHSAKQGSRFAIQDEEPEQLTTHYSALFAIGVENGRRFIPWVAIGNHSTRPVMVLIEFQDSNGQPMSLPFRNPNGGLQGYYPAALAEFPPGSDMGPSLLTDTNERMRFGWVRITSDAPEALTFTNFMTIVEGSRWGVFTQPSVEASFLPLEVRVENTPSTKQTWISIVNPMPDPVEIELTPRRNDGSKPCPASKMMLRPGQQIWRTVQSLMSPCMRSGMPNYTLRIEPLDGEIVVQAYFDYGNLIYATAIVDEVEPESEDLAFSLSSAAKPVERRASASPCVATLAAMRPVPRAGEGDLEFEVRFEDCAADQPWLLKKSSTWFQFVNAQGREVPALAGSGNARISVRVNPEQARRLTTPRTGHLYLFALKNGGRGRQLVRVSFPHSLSQL